MAPGMRQATVEKVAIQAVMAGCTAEQMPLALALAELLCQKKVAEALGVRQPPVLQIAVGGPAAGTIGADGTPGADSLGRLVRLMLIHLGGVPGPALEAKRSLGHASRAGQGRGKHGRPHRCRSGGDLEAVDDGRRQVALEYIQTTAQRFIGAAGTSLARVIECFFRIGTVLLDRNESGKSGYFKDLFDVIGHGTQKQPSACSLQFFCRL